VQTQKNKSPDTKDGAIKLLILVLFYVQLIFNF